ncbi:MAG: lysophospholipid acyltransferase family protein [Fodinibius sp.]|nr:lysophospholipid acyltransferase family protein [Fodinibius sp.]
MILRLWATLTALIIGMQITKKGEPPKPPFFLVANHLSYLDVVPLWRYLDGTFVAKSEIKSWPFFGWATQTLGVLFIDRAHKQDAYRMNNRIAETISNEQGVIIFPEGTSTSGKQVLPFNAPLLAYPARNTMPVHFATVRYRSRYDRWPAHKHICWWGDMPFLPHFWELLKMPRFEVTISFGDYAVSESDRKQLAANLHHSVAQNFDPIENPQKR